MNTDVLNFESYSQFKNVCLNLIQNNKNMNCVKELCTLIRNSPETFIKVVQPTILSTLGPIIISISKNKLSFRDDEKQLIVDALTNLFDKSTVNTLHLFFNIYGFLIFEIYDLKQHIVLPLHEEYKLSIMKCMTSLAKSVSSDFIPELYVKENAPKLCQMLYAAMQLAKNEQLKSLRIAAIECIMAIARVLEDKDFEDIVIRNQVAEVFLFFLPGIATGLKQVALVDEKIGHKVPMVSLKAWGRIVTLLMQDYNATDDNFYLKHSTDNTNIVPEIHLKKKWKNEKELSEYLHATKRTVQWYKDTDNKMQALIIDLSKLSHHSHRKIRLELLVMCELIIKNCFKTMPKSVSYLIEIVITLSEDEDEEISTKSKLILHDISNQLPTNTFKSLLENLEEGFCNCINSLPRKFNAVDEREQLAALNLLVGYLSLFGKHKLIQVLFTADHLNKLVSTLLHISELEKNISLMEDYTTKDLNLPLESNMPWKKFRNFHQSSVQMKLEKLCALLVKWGTFRIVSDFLLDTFMFQVEHRKEAIFILNGIISGAECSPENLQIIKNILNTYTDSDYWQLPMSVIEDEFGNKCSLAEVHYNIIQICLLVEGIGQIALALQNHFQEFLFKTMYLVLERAGSGHPLVRAAGLLALKNVTFACGYSSITDLINKNIDYFTYHVERKLIRMEDKENVLNVLSAVLKYSTFEVLQYIGDIVQEVLIQSCDRFKEKYITSFLRLFKIFLQSLRRWLNIEVNTEQIIAKEQKSKDMEYFEVSEINMADESFSDDIMGKTAEEMFNEDMEKGQKELLREIDEPEVEAYKKPDPPLQIKLTVVILSRSLHFLPTKDREKKLLVLEILSSGLDILRDWEDELLPIVHQIWSPLVPRFNEINDPLIINYSFQLLITLARLSKEFIKLRTTKEVLPSILEVLDKLSQESYLKDKGSAYRYTQAYKLQLILLENLGKVLIDLNIQEDVMNKIVDCVFKYLSDKQPVPLQMACIEFFKILAIYDSKTIKSKVTLWQEEDANIEYKKSINQLYSILEKIK